MITVTRGVLIQGVFPSASPSGAHSQTLTRTGLLNCHLMSFTMTTAPGQHCKCPQLFQDGINRLENTDVYLVFATRMFVHVAYTNVYTCMETVPGLDFSAQNGISGGKRCPVYLHFGAVIRVVLLYHMRILTHCIHYSLNA